MPYLIHIHANFITYCLCRCMWVFFSSNNSNSFLTCLMCLCLCPQWKGWYCARLWLPGQLCVARDDQRDRGEVVLPLQPWKPGHVLWSKTLITRFILIFTRVLCHVVVNFSSQAIKAVLCVSCWLLFCSVTAWVWSLWGSSSASAARRRAWSGWEFTRRTPASTTNGTCRCTFNYGT